MYFSGNKWSHIVELKVKVDKMTPLLLSFSFSFPPPKEYVFSMCNWGHFRLGEDCLSSPEVGGLTHSTEQCVFLASADNFFDTLLSATRRLWLGYRRTVGGTTYLIAGMQYLFDACH